MPQKFKGCVYIATRKHIYFYFLAIQKILFIQLAINIYIFSYMLSLFTSICYETFLTMRSNNFYRINIFKTEQNFKFKFKFKSLRPFFIMENLVLFFYLFYVVNLFKFLLTSVCMEMNLQ